MGLVSFEKDVQGLGRFSRRTQVRHVPACFSRPNRFTELSWRKAKTLERVARRGKISESIIQALLVVYRNHCDAE